MLGAVLLTLGACAGLSFVPLRIFGGAIRVGGALGFALASYLLDSLNLAGALLATATAIVVSLYLVSTFTICRLRRVVRRAARLDAAPSATKWRVWRERMHAALDREGRTVGPKAALAGQGEDAGGVPEPSASGPGGCAALGAGPGGAGEEAAEEAEYASIEEIPICPIEDPVRDAPRAIASGAAACACPRRPRTRRNRGRSCTSCRPPNCSTRRLARNPYDEQELKDTAARIKSKFEEFNVLGNVVQINPGPVVTTFEFKPEAGIKYSRITTLMRGSVPGLAGRIDPHRAHPRQAHRGHRSAQYAARADRVCARCWNRTSSRNRTRG